MMDVLPPKWTELFEQEEDQVMTNDHHIDEYRTIGSSQRSCHWHNSAQYNTYHQSCTIHTQPRHFSCSPRKTRTHSCASNAVGLEPLTVINKEGETELRGTRFRLTKATLDQYDDDSQQHV